MFQCKRCLVGPFFHKRHHEDDQEDGYQHQQDDAGDDAAEPIPQGIFLQFNGRDLVVADVIPFQIPQKNDTDDGRHQHQHGYHSPLLEIRDTAQHFVVKHRCHHFIFTPYGSGNTVIRKAEEETLYNGCRQCTQQRTEHCLEKGGDAVVPHDPGNHHEFLVDIPHGVEDQQEGNGQCVNHIAKNQTAETVNIKQLCADELCQKPLFPEGVNDGKAVCNGRQQHGQNCQQADELFIFRA